MKKLTLLLIISTLLFCACTQQMTDEKILARAEEIQSEQATATPEVTEEPTTEPTAEPTEEPAATLYAGRYPHAEKSESELRSIYSDFLPHITDDSLDKLFWMYNELGVIISLDGKKFQNGRFANGFVPTPTDKYDIAIEVTYNFFDFLVSKGGENMKYMIDDSLSYVYLSHGTGGGAGQTSPTNDGEFIIDYSIYNYEEKWIHPLMLEELTDNIVWGCDLYMNEFKSYNGFDIYNKTWLQEYDQLVDAGVFKTKGDSKYYFYNEGGLLTRYGHAQINDDWSDYQLGLWFNEDNFWTKYYYSETIRIKTQAQLKQYQRVNPDLTLEFFYNLSCPDYALSCPDGNRIVLEDFYDKEGKYDISYVYEYIENN